MRNPNHHDTYLMQSEIPREISKESGEKDLANDSHDTVKSESKEVASIQFLLLYLEMYWWTEPTTALLTMKLYDEKNHCEHQI